MVLVVESRSWVMSLVYAPRKGSHQFQDRQSMGIKPMSTTFHRHYPSLGTSFSEV